MTEGLFDGVLYYLNDSLELSLRAKLTTCLERGGATSYTPPTAASASRFPPDSITHIITDTVALPEYSDLQGKVAFVTPRWVTVSHDLRILQETRFYSADPRQIFSGVVVSVAEMPGKDGDHLKAMVTAYGGQHRGPLTKEVTHLIAINKTGRKYEQAITKGKALGMQVVLPHWVWDSFRATMRMPEDVFRFPDPPLFHPERWRPKKGMAKAPSDTMQVDEEDSDGDLPELSTTVLVERQTSKTADEHYKRYLDTASRDIVTASGSKQLHQMLRKDEVGAFASQYANAPQIFAGHVIFLAEDVACSDAVVDSLERRVQASGGAFVSGKGLDALEADEALLAADMVICAHRSGWTYWKAHEDGKTIANLGWLVHVLATGKLDAPLDHLLHYPVPKEPIAGFDDLHLTVSNYTGASRELLKRMIDLMGGRFSGELRKNRHGNQQPTTHLIAAQLVGDKVEHAKDFDLPIVNHLWLEACFIHWDIVPLHLNTKYLDYPEGYHYGDLLGKARLPSTSIYEWASRPAFVAERTVCLEAHDAAVKTARAARPSAVSPQRRPVITVVPSSSAARRRVIDLEMASDSSQGEAGEMEVDPFVATAPQTVHSTATQVAAQLLPAPAVAKVVAPPASSRPKALVKASTSKDALATPQIKPRKALSPTTGSSSATKRISSTIDESAIVSTTSRRAAATGAVTKLRENAVDMTRFQEEQKSSAAKAKRAAARRQSGGSGAASSDSEEEDVDVVARPAKKSRTSGPLKATSGNVDADAMQVDLPGTKVKAEKPASKKTTFKMLQSGDKLDDKTLKALAKLGVQETDRPDQCTHVCIKSASRTEKILLAMARKPFFVTHEWALASAKANVLQDESDYIVNDSFRDAVDRAERGGPLFKDHQFIITPKPDNGFSVLERLIKAHGGTVSTHRLAKDWLKDLDFDTVHVISSAKDESIWKPWRAAAPQLDIRRADFVVQAILQQDLSEDRDGRTEL